MRNLITAAMLACTVALAAGCGGVSFRSPIVPKSSPKPAVQTTAPAAAAVPAATTAQVAKATSETFDPGVLSAEQKDQNLKKCQNWGKLSAAEKKTKDFFCWQHVGADPYQGKVETALAQSNWPAEVQQLFLNQIRQGNKAEMVLERGMTFDWSTFGKGVSKAFVHHNVVADWKEGEVHPASVFTASHGGKIYKLYLPRDCGNWSGNVYTVPTPPAAVQPPATPAVTVDECRPPDGKYLFTVHAWKALPPGSLHDEAARHIAAAKARDSQQATRAAAYVPDDVSKTMGYRLRKGGGQHSPATWAVAVFLRNPQTLAIEENLDVLKVVEGTGSILLTEAQHLKLIEVTNWPSKFDSPVSSGGEQRLWTFAWEWGKHRCMNVHGLEKP